MDHQYGVGVLNRYALLLNDEADPLDALKLKEKKRKSPKDSHEKENKAKPDQARPSKAAALSHSQTPQQTPQQQTPQQPQQNAQQQAGSSPPAAGLPPRRQQGIRDQQNVRPQQGQQGANSGKGPRPQPPPGQLDRPPRRRDDRPNGPAAPLANPAGDSEAARAPRRDFGDRRPNNYERRPHDGQNPDGERRGPPRERGGGGGGRGVGSAGGRGSYDNRGKREFDRRSGSDRTGVKPVDKREGAGSHNWGSHKDDLEDFNKTNSSEGEIADPESKTEAPVAVDPNGVPAEPTEGKTDDESPKVPTEEEPKELTLDEWKALRGNRQKPQYNLRKAGEGEDLSQWKDMVALTKAKADGEDTDDEYDNAEYPQRVGRQKKVIGIEFTFYEPRRGGGAGRGGRGRGGRGGGGGGGGARPRREDAPAAPVERPRTARQNAPKVDDNKDFPSLG